METVSTSSQCVNRKGSIQRDCVWGPGGRRQVCLHAARTYGAAGQPGWPHSMRGVGKHSQEFLCVCHVCRAVLEWQAAPVWLGGTHGPALSWNSLGHCARVCQRL